MKSLLFSAAFLALGALTVESTSSSAGLYPHPSTNEALHADLEFIQLGGEAAQFQLYMLPNSPTEYNAMCLDGSPYGVYYSPGSGTDAYNWMIYFQGGGWCYSTGDCVGRSHGTLGSSKAWASTGAMSGMLSGDCNVNPTFCNWTKVWLPYCDGTSFSGNNMDPVYYAPTNTTLYFRGHNNLVAAMAAVSQGVMNPVQPWSSAYDIVLTGCSAGGLSTHLHANYFSETFVAPNRPPPPALVEKAKTEGKTSVRNGNFYVIPISGYFLDAANVDSGEHVYTNEIADIFYLSNSTSGVDAACVAAQQPGNEHLCMMAPYVYPYIKPRIFTLNSFYDSWQTGCVLTAEPVYFPNNTAANGNCSAAPGWSACSGNPESCTTAQMGPLNNFRSVFGNFMNSSTTVNNEGNGGFITSCHTHCEAQNDSPWMTFTINGVTMRDAVAQWMQADPNAPAINNFYWDCEYNADSTPHNCNPSC